MSNIVIGIEGYVGAGKSAICRELLNHIPNSIILEYSDKIDPNFKGEIVVIRRDL